MGIAESKLWSIHHEDSVKTAARLGVRIEAAGTEIEHPETAAMCLSSDVSDNVAREQGFGLSMQKMKPDGISGSMRLQRTVKALYDKLEVTDASNSQARKKSLQPTTAPFLRRMQTPRFSCSAKPSKVRIVCIHNFADILNLGQWNCFEPL